MDNLIFGHFIRNDGLDLVQAGRERLEIDDLAILDGNAVSFVPVRRDFELFLAVDEKIEAADALEERKIAHGGSNLTHDSSDLALNLLELLRGRSGCGIDLIRVVVLIRRLGVNFKVPALENLLGVNVGDDQRKLLDFVLRQPLYREKRILLQHSTSNVNKLTLSLPENIFQKFFDFIVFGHENCEAILLDGLECLGRIDSALEKNRVDSIIYKNKIAKLAEMH